MADTSSALAVIQAQQNIVGRSVVGGSAAVLDSSPDTVSTGILEQIREISVNQLRVLRELVNKFQEMLSNQNEQERIARDQKAEQEKESISPADAGTGEDVNREAQDEGKQKSETLSKIGGFLMGLPGVAVISKMFGGILRFFNIFKMFGRFGPIGAVILGFTLLFKYSKEIGEALAPVVDKIKNLITILQPVTDIILKIGDFLIKTVIEGIGSVLEGLINDVTMFIEGFKKLFSGDIIGGLKDIFGGILRFIFAIPIAIFRFAETAIKNLVTAIEPWWNNLVLGVTTWVSSAFDSVIGWFSNIASFIGEMFNTAWINIKTFFSDLPDRILGFVGNMFSPIFDFFKGIGARIKASINGIIDSLPLPDFLKDKMKFDTKETEEDIEGVKEKYKEDISPGEREMKTGTYDGVTQDEALAELQGEKYIKTKYTTSGTAGYDSGAGVLTPEQYQEMEKLDTTQQKIDYLKSLNEKEQERRNVIIDLAKQKIDFEKQQQDLKDELLRQQQQRQEMMMDSINNMVSPDDYMFEAPPKRVLTTDTAGGTPGYTNVNNNPISINNVTSTKKADMTINKLSPSAGDPYFDRMFYNGA